MIDEKKPREFWFPESGQGWLGGISYIHTNKQEAKALSKANGTKMFHVIEYSAFVDQANKIENLELALKIKNEVCEAINDNGQQAFLLQQRNQKLEKVVELMTHLIKYTDYMVRQPEAITHDELIDCCHGVQEKIEKTLAEVDAILKEGK